MSRPTVEDRFWSHVDRRGPDNCWPWLGWFDAKGYGKFWIAGRKVSGARYCLALSLGRPLLPGAFACHHCDNPGCVNPAHIYEGTARSNSADMVARGRNRSSRRRRPDTMMRKRLAAAERRGDGVVADDVDYRWWREMDETAAKNEIAAFVRRREMGEIDGRCQWLDPVMSFVPAAQ